MKKAYKSFLFFSFRFKINVKQMYSSKDLLGYGLKKYSPKWRMEGYKKKERKKENQDPLIEFFYIGMAHATSLYDHSTHARAERTPKIIFGSVHSAIYETAVLLVLLNNS